MYKEGFRARKFILLKWFLLGGLLSWAYLSTLLATLVVIEYEKTIEQLVQERTKERSHLLTQAEEKVEEVRQVRIEIEDVKRASKDLTKKYSRTREAISGYITAEAELKGEVESLVGRVSVKLSFEKVKKCYR